MLPDRQATDGPDLDSPPPAQVGAVRAIAPGASPLSLVTAFSSDPVDPDSIDGRRHVLLWIAFLALAILLHFAVLYFLPSGWSPADLRETPVPVDIHQVDPRKLEAIKRQWRQQQQQQLLLNKDRSKPIPAAPPPDARYMSDRNRQVEREQRARDTAILPKPGTPQPPQAAQPPRTAQATRPSQPAPPSSASPRFRMRQIPNLGNLGVPLHLNRPVRPAAPRAMPLNPAERPAAPPPGGDQYVDDRSLPTGGENMLNTQESVYYSFYARLYETIGPIWESGLHAVGFRRSNIQPGDYSTVVDVIFDREGNVIGVQHLQSSGIPEFDDVVSQAWKRAGRFPNPPAGLLNRAGEVHTGWNFTVKVGSAAVQFLPPARQY